MSESISSSKRSSGAALTEFGSTDELVSYITSTNALDTTLSKRLAVQPNSLFQSYTSEGLDPLTILDPQQHSLGYLYFLSARCLAVRDPSACQFHAQTFTHFLSVCDINQLLKYPNRLHLIPRALEHLSKVLRNALLPIRPLNIAISRFSNETHVFTAMHAPLIKSCLLAKHYRAALHILNSDIETIEPDRYGFSIQDILAYYYYGAMIYIGNKYYERAIEFLTLTISAPSQAISMIQLEAYKKYILVCIIQDGKLRSLPKYTSSLIEKGLKMKFPAYFDIAEASEKGFGEFKAVIDKYSENLESDSNMGLAKQCVQALLRQKIKLLANVYSTVSLAEIAEMFAEHRLSESDIESMLLDMIGKDQVKAEISNVSDEQGHLVKMINFAESDIDETSDTVQMLERRITDASAMGKKLAVMDKLEALNPEFQSKYMMLSSHGGQLGMLAYEEDIDFPSSEDSKAFA
ncbi:hypothetical protein VTP01DRAFT_4172 [Rhizomucor pusillus]|uniref:uncharacterized protein n=1 Tax=Rhizomucor pusillus TaxID=4840 RepID=UPI003742CE79